TGTTSRTPRRAGTLPRGRGREGAGRARGRSIRRSSYGHSSEVIDAPPRPRMPLPRDMALREVALDGDAVVGVDLNLLAPDVGNHGLLLDLRLLADDHALAHHEPLRHHELLLEDGDRDRAVRQRLDEPRV